MSKKMEGAMAPKFEIYRMRDARPYHETSVLRHEPVSDTVAQGAKMAVEAGMGEGHDLKLLFEAPGFTLSYAWFKSGYPLPRHTHNVDCLYYILGGSLKIGTEELGKGDGFFIGSEVPYTYTPGEQGVEVLEFRPSNDFNIKVLANNLAFWEKAAQAVAGQRESWRTQPRPSTIEEPA